MSVLIKGMEMPKSCITCRMECIARIHDSTKRSKDCPLVSVPAPHGRLVDIDKALEVIAHEWGYDGIEDDLQYKVQTVIESEE